MKKLSKRLLSFVTLASITFTLSSKPVSAQIADNKNNLYATVESQDLSKSESTNDYGLASSTKDGVILHAWNWYFNDVKKYMSKIAECGYTSVQVSPIQPNKDGTFGDTKGWWKLYQPTDFAIGNTLGSKDDFKSMCDEADKYGIKIIVDVVSNHLANSTGKGNNASWDRSSQIPDYIKNNDSYWHGTNYGAFSNDNDRNSMTQGAIGMPDLNTANKDLQNIILKYLNEAQDLGADGFRFDAAKHIELPTDQISSDYWPTITGGIKSKDPNAFIYGEVLNTCATDITNYTKYINITDNRFGWNIEDAVQNTNAGLANNYTWTDNPKHFITWVESHDTYAGDYGRKSIGVSDDNIKLGWYMIAARADSVPLFFVRPSGGMGGSIGGPGDTTWQDSAVVAVNKFHNHFAGQTEYVRSLNNNSVFEVERGTSGVVIVNLGGGTADINTDTKLANGTYKDQVSGSIFTVSNGKLTGTVNGKSVAVAYNPTDSTNPTNPTNPTTNPTTNSTTGSTTRTSVSKTAIYFKKPSGFGDNISAYVYTGSGSSATNNGAWPGVSMTKESDGLYSYEVPSNLSDGLVIFSDGKTQIPASQQPGIPMQLGKLSDGSSTWSEVPVVTPTNPATQTPTNPATQTPTNPATQTPTNPATQTPTNPATQTPTNPATQTPTNPATQTPTNPATQTPTNPTTPTTPTSTVKLNYNNGVAYKVGNKINLNANVSDSKNYTYRFRVVNNSVTKNLSDYVSGNSFDWAPTSAGSYNVYVEAKDSTGTVIKSDSVLITVGAADIPAQSTTTPSVPNVPSNPAVTFDGNSIFMLSSLMSASFLAVLGTKVKRRNKKQNA